MGTRSNCSGDEVRELAKDFLSGLGPDHRRRTSHEAKRGFISAVGATTV